MTFTVWMHDRLIGETDFELAPIGERRAGVFRPTQYGLSVLPGITCMFPALLELHAVCRRHGINPDDDALTPDHPDLDFVSATPAGQRVIEAARYISQVELRDRTGRILPWEALMISDADEIANAVAHIEPDEVEAVERPASPMRYFISATIKLEKRRRPRWSSFAGPPPRS